ncbi:hypothetical protein CEUSTIGMA_g5420.t1 [Chlamydomonas eustigma]|uniref:Ubiquitin-like protease family profile domain-containing protein n=1 Tax=Chlamydomonas eustigma TaxID=1157962 RepID=A0A250X4H0_9CHLO|nr:hypothetical protein CEUSTIGMA_g5420.t1 [Chlamydomonas eustigma]|eukprot:GAX77978.1 hypothetical protein CEUSTIGMA_g5420.t1 [Chlamydomonas eustigma]
MLADLQDGAVISIGSSSDEEEEKRMQSLCSTKDGDGPLPAWVLGTGAEAGAAANNNNISRNNNYMLLNANYMKSEDGLQPLRFSERLLKPPGSHQTDGADLADLMSKDVTVELHTSDAQKFKGLKFVYPPNGERAAVGRVEVTAEDINRIEAEEFLNDTVIDFYIQWIEKHLPEESRQRYYFFNSFFYKKLTEKHKVVKKLAGGKTVEEFESDDDE